MPPQKYRDSPAGILAGHLRVLDNEVGDAIQYLDLTRKAAINLRDHHQKLHELLETYRKGGGTIDQDDGRWRKLVSDINVAAHDVMAYAGKVTTQCNNSMQYAYRFMSADDMYKSTNDHAVEMREAGLDG